ncbi:Asp23/Gls24 family envelope stress response protein [Streptomyces sp. A0592]|uniref:Asp23/Gls24 family envelope stress response protein n=1 Tax=Streptomyces sp. A0592 TaxID=2563099 RepID=UPI00109E507F|nr:Asp23/Gls24 family envelope stress response protein [Streptomyces sp. A0592]THA75444.1 Asp23/Gls24 family envelope stress response protein [Streptomyces sp. A0592]
MSDTSSPATGGSESHLVGKSLSGQVSAGAAAGTRGRTTIADSVVEKIAGMAVREVPGIHSLGSGMARTLGAVSDKVSGSPSVARGVKVEVGERQAAIDLDVVVEYGVSITDLAADVRTSVITAVEGMTGLEVVEVNIAVDDVHLPDEEDDQEGGGRVE